MAGATATTNRPAQEPTAVLKDLLGTAILAALIFGPTLGIKVYASPTGLELHQSWHRALIAIAVVLVLRLAILLLGPVLSGGGGETSAAMGRAVAPYVKFLLPAFLIFAVVLPFLPMTDRRLLDIAIFIVMYIMLGWGLNIVVGLAGLLDLGYVAFFAVGSYTYALLAQRYFPLWFPEWMQPFTFWIVLPIAGLLAGLWGVILGFPVLRLRGDYLAIVTLAFGEIIRVVLRNWYDFTNGPTGVTQIPRVSFFGLPFQDGPGGFSAYFGLAYSTLHRFIFYYYLILILALVTYAVSQRLRKLPVGRAWEALREDEIACRSLGINTVSTKLTAFAIGAMFAGFAGSFSALRLESVYPDSFTFTTSALILAIVVLGGLGSQIGVMLSAIVIIGMFEVFRELKFLEYVLPEGMQAVELRMLFVGLAMVLIMRWKPRGLITSREPTVFLSQKKRVSGDLVSQGKG